MEVELNEEKIKKALQSVLGDILRDELTSRVMSSFVRSEIVKKLSKEVVDKTIKEMFSKDDIKNILREVFEERMQLVFDDVNGVKWEK